MYIVYGAREYGRIDEHAGEYGATTFFHIWYAPLFPLSPHWTTPTGRKPMRWSGKSVAAAYLRLWAPVAAIGCLSAAFATHSHASAAGRIAPIIAAIALLAASAWSWTWRSLRGAAAHRRSDFNFVAYGTRCEPARMDLGQRAIAKRQLDSRWTDRALTRGADSPNEVAQRGPADAAEAVLAYGLLRLASIERGRAGATDAADADRILSGEFTAPATDDGPYRAAGLGAAPPSAPAPGAATATSAASSPASSSTASSTALADLVEARAAETAQPRRMNDPIAERRKRRRRSRLQAVGLVFLSFAMLGSIGAAVSANRSTLDVTIKELRSVKPPTGRTVRVACDSVEPPLWEEYDEHQHTTARITMCDLGNYLLPVRLDADDPVPSKIVEGELRTIESHELWVREGLSEAPEIEARTTEVYVDTGKGHDGAAMIAWAVAMLVGTPLLWFLWFRARKRYRSAA